MADNEQTFMRRKTRSVAVGNITIGGGNPITVQSMTNCHTYDVDACLGQIQQMIERKCEIVRVAVPTARDTAAMAEIIKQVSVPIVADVHFHYSRAIEAVEAGVSKIRLNPGNISDREQVNEVIDACKAHDCSIRVGVNEGSIVERRNKQKYQHELEQDLVELMLEKLADYVRIFEDRNFEKLVLSAKCHDAQRTIAVNRAISRKFDYPLHLGVTHAGDVQTGSIRSAAALGALLAEGIGDTIRVSLAGDPLAEIGVAWEILNTLKLRPRCEPELIACPTCGRTEIDLLGMVEAVKKALTEIHQPISVAVMGCVVNGPGEADGADFALCGGREKAVIYAKGKKVATIPANLAVETLMEQIKKSLHL